MGGKRNLFILFVIMVLLAPIVGSASAGRIIHVDADAIGSNNGSSWENAFWCLQNAIAATRYGDEIRVAEGMYRPDRKVVFGRIPIIVASGERTATFQLKSGVVIKGGYAGFGEPNPDARDVELYQTILSGDLNGNDGPDFVNNAENSYHVVTGSGTDATAVLDGFTITAGNANGTDWESYGGGMYNLDGSSPTLTNCSFISNWAEYGGGMHNYKSSPTVEDCTFSNNSAIYGGGIYNEESNPVVSNCRFFGNFASTGGGGMFIWKNSNPTLVNCTFSDNLAEWNGGGIFNWEGCNPKLIDCTFNRNSADRNGGGMSNLNNSSPTVTNCTFSGNSADRGGGMFNEESNPTLTLCTFRGNSVKYYGGGMHNWHSSKPTLANCVFCGNLSKSGGGIVNLGGSRTTLINCTFSGNFAKDYGGGIDNRSSNLTLTNCILWGDTPKEAYIDGGILAISYSNIQGGWPGVGNIDADPCFVDPDSNDFHLLPDSPCINKGNPTGDYSRQTDIDGESRVMLGRVDMGADEFNPFIFEFDVVEKRRIGRTVFEYDCKVTLQNVSRFAVNNIQLTLAEASSNMTIIEPNVTFGDIEVAAGESATSVDTCTFRVDRSEAIDPAEIIWHVTAELADSGVKMEHTLSSRLSLGPKAVVGFDGLREIAAQWLWQGPAGGIEEDSVQDGTVNLLDFARLANNWLGSR